MLLLLEVYETALTLVGVMRDVYLDPMRVIVLLILGTVVFDAADTSVGHKTKETRTFSML